MMPLGFDVALNSILPDFPIGLILRYDKETIYYSTPSITQTWSDTFYVVQWADIHNTSIRLDYGYNQNDPREFTSYTLFLPSWVYEYYDTELNRTVSRWMYPLWIDTSNWNAGDNITIPSLGEHTHVYQIKRQESIAIGEKSIRCWIARAEFVDTNDWDYTWTLCYDSQYGILVKVNTIRNPGIGDPNYATHEGILSASNIMNHLYETSPEPITYSLTSFLIFGIVFEIIAILGILGMKRTKRIN